MVRLFHRSSDDRLRRALCVLVLALFVIVLVAGLAHLAGAAHAPFGAHDCGLCAMLVQVSVALPLVVAVLSLRAATAPAFVAACAPQLLRARECRPPPARGPPARS